MDEAKNAVDKGVKSRSAFGELVVLIQIHLSAV